MDIETRDILLYGDVAEETVSEVVKSIIDFNYIDSLSKQELSNYEPEPIFLYVNTYGGDAYECFGLCDIIKHSSTPIYTIGLGKIMSAGLPIFTSGHARYVYPNTTFMYHSVSSGIQGKIHDMKVDIRETERLQEIYNKILLESTKLSEKDVEQMLNSHKDVYFTSDEAKEMGFCEGIIGVDVII